MSVIKEGDPVSVWYGMGEFRQKTTGVVQEVIGDSYRVEITVGGAKTYVRSKEVELIGNPEQLPVEPKLEELAETQPDSPVVDTTIVSEAVVEAEEAGSLQVMSNVVIEESEREVKTEVDNDKWMKPLRYDMEFMGPWPTAYRIAGRQKIRGIRHYVALYEDQQEPWFMPSVTSLIDKVMPKDEQFIKYMVNNFGSYDEFSVWLNEKAGYGTVVHGAIADFVNGVLPDFEDKDGWHGYMTMATERTGHKSKAGAWTEGTKEAVLDFWKWCHDYQVKIILLEQPLSSRKRWLAGQLDLFVEMNSHIQAKSGKRAGEPTRVMAIVDIKTGDAQARYNGQLGMYGEMLLETFPGLKKIMADKYPHQEGLEYGIFTPKPFRKDPKYVFGWKTDKVVSYMKDTFELHHKLFMQQLKKPGSIRVFSGKPALDGQWDSVLSYKSLEEEWLDRIKNGEYGEDVEIVTEEDDDEEES